MALIPASTVRRAEGGLATVKDRLKTGDRTDTGACLTGELAPANDSSLRNDEKLSWGGPPCVLTSTLPLSKSLVPIPIE